MRLKNGPWGFGAGIVLGLMIGSASLSVAAFGYKGWQRFGRDFQLGYLTGFFDMANLARNLDPDGYVDENFPLWPKARLTDWHNAVNELYMDPENREYGMYAILRLAAEELKKKYGPAPSAAKRLQPAFTEQIQRARKAEQEALSKDMAQKAQNSQEPAAAASAVPKKVPDPSVGPSWDHRKRRCPCPDGAKDSTNQHPAAEDSAPALSSTEPAKAGAAEPQRAEPVKPQQPTKAGATPAPAKTPAGSASKQ